MAKSRYRAPRGTFDVLPPEARLRSRIERVAAEIFDRAGYETIATPIFEDTELFERGVGQSTDIVRKEMFTFEDKSNRSITLRPEGTAPICRAYLEYGMHKLPQPVKFSYAGPFFRHERPQAGRYRQFHQLGIEAIGTSSPLADAEVIMLLSELLIELDVPGLELRIGSLGSADARRAYVARLADYLREEESELPDAVIERIDSNPLRAFDSKDKAVQDVMSRAPTLIAGLEGEDAAHFREVCGLLGAAGLDFKVDPTLVRGLDYYSRTVFSFVCDRLGAQSEIGGGGRYDGLIEQLGGPPTPAVGWAVGVERILLALSEDPEMIGGEAPSGDVLMIIADTERSRQAVTFAKQLRQAGFSAHLELAGRLPKKALAHADRLGVSQVLLLDLEGPPRLRNMRSGEQRDIDATRIVEEVRKAS